MSILPVPSQRRAEINYGGRPTKKDLKPAQFTIAEEILYDVARLKTMFDALFASATGTKKIIAEWKRPEKEALAAYCETAGITQAVALRVGKLFKGQIEVYGRDPEVKSIQEWLNRCFYVPGKESDDIRADIESLRLRAEMEADLFEARRLYTKAQADLLTIQADLTKKAHVTEEDIEASIKAITAWVFGWWQGHREEARVPSLHPDEWGKYLEIFSAEMDAEVTRILTEEEEEEILDSGFVPEDDQPAPYDNDQPAPEQMDADGADEEPE